LKATTKIMAKDQASSASTARGGLFKNSRRPSQTAPINAPEKDAAKPKFNPLRAIINSPRFFREVRAEARKITWPSRKETWITSVMVGIMVLITTLFFFVVDLITGWAVGHVVRLGS
jgi:preprotein translocase subunit SecE